MRTISAGCDAVLARLHAGHPVLAVLDDLAHVADRAAGAGTAASILVLDRAGRLRSAAGPRLPRSYAQAVDGIQPDPDVGTCAAAAAIGEEVVTPNFMECGKWRELRHLPLALGFVGASSRPIRSLVDARVLGTFGMYFRDIRIPTDAERSLVRELARAAACALEQCVIEDELARRDAGELPALREG